MFIELTDGSLAKVRFQYFIDDGVTVADAVKGRFNEEGEELSVSTVESGQSLCSKKDAFSRPIGRKWAFRRLVCNLFPKGVKNWNDLRQAAWDEYAHVFPKDVGINE